MSTRFFRCSHCGNLTTVIKDAGVPMLCCGQKMDELIANSVEAAGEKHVPDVKIEGNTVKVNVGTVDHPMLEAHFIEWIYLETKNGGQIKYLKPGQAPAAAFVLEDDEAVAVYAYCNLHGLWVAEV